MTTQTPAASTKRPVTDLDGIVDGQTRQAVRRYIEAVRAEYPLEQAILFGSRARGTHRPDSDADVALVLKPPVEPAPSTALHMADIAYDVLLETGLNISPLPVSKWQWDHPQEHPNPDLLERIEAEGIRL